MNTHVQEKAPLRGLLVYLFHSVSSSFAVVLLLCFAMAAALLVTGNRLVYTFFGYMGVLGPPYVILMNMGGRKYGKWERFQISMPVKRTDLVKSQYLSVLLASIVGIPLVVVVTAISFQLHEALFDYTMPAALINIAALLALPLFMLGLLFPLSCTKIGEDKQEGLTFVCLVIAIVIPSLISVVGGRLGFPEGVPALLSFALSVIVFLGSYVITKKLYVKMDF